MRTHVRMSSGAAVDWLAHGACSPDSTGRRVLTAWKPDPACARTPRRTRRNRPAFEPCRAANMARSESHAHVPQVREEAAAERALEVRHPRRAARATAAA